MTERDRYILDLSDSELLLYHQGGPVPKLMQRRLDGLIAQTAWEKGMPTPRRAPKPPPAVYPKRLRPAAAKPRHLRQAA